MVKRTSMEGAECPVARSLDAIGDWWSLLIVRDAFDGLRRFGEFQRNLGMAKKHSLGTPAHLGGSWDFRSGASVGRQRISGIRADGEGQGPVPVDHRVTAVGRGVFHEAGEAHSRVVDRENGRPVRPLELRAEDGRLLGPEDCVRIAAQ